MKILILSLSLLLSSQLALAQNEIVNESFNSDGLDMPSVNNQVDNKLNASTLLHDAAVENDTRAIKSLVKEGVSINARDEHGRTPLHVTTLVRSATDFSNFFDFEYAPVGSEFSHIISNILFYTYISADARFTKRLVKYGADVRAIDSEGRTSLHNTSSNGHVKSSKILIKNEADINAQDDKGETPLHSAVGLSRAAVINKGQPKTTKLLLKNGANPNIQDNYGRTPLLDTASYGQLKNTNSLLIYGANPNIQDNYGYTPLHDVARRNNIKIAKRLVRYGANPNIQDNDGNTPLHITALYGLEKFAEFLVESGADPNIKNNEGQTPFDVAVINQHVTDKKLKTSKTKTPKTNQSSCKKTFE